MHHVDGHMHVGGHMQMNAPMHASANLSKIPDCVGMQNEMLAVIGAYSCFTHWQALLLLHEAQSPSPAVDCCTLMSCVAAQVQC